MVDPALRPRAAVWLCAALVLSVLPCAMAQEQPKPPGIGWDDGVPAGYRSIAMAGYATVFEVPADQPVLKSVWIHASRYGVQQPRDLTLVISDQDLVPVAILGVPYDLLEWSDRPKWTEIRLPQEVRPPEQFAVSLYCHCLQTWGVYLSYDDPGGKHLSYTLDGNTPSPLLIADEPYNWMIRCEMADKHAPPDDPNPPIFLQHDDGTAESIQSLGGQGQAVRFKTPDDGAYIVDRVLICGAFYGMPNAAQNEEFEVHVCDAAGVSIASRKFIYGEFYRGDKPTWTSLPMPEGTEVSGDFSIFANMNSRQTPGVYVGYDTDGGAEANFSMVGTPGALQPAKFREGNNETTNWCIRCVIHKKP